MNEVVYHYCSVDTFFNIIKNSSIWLSDISKSNDYQECVRCRELVNKGMEEYLRDDVEALQAWSTWYEKSAYSNLSMKTFCVCFSESKDKLSQWRRYAQDGQGIAIGFDKKVLGELNQISKFDIAFGKVIYDNPQEYVQGIITDNILFSKVKYRTANNKLIPYIEMNFEKVKQRIIKKIFIGPKSEVEVEDIVNLLSFYGYYDGIEGGYNFQEPVNIKKSSTTYR